MVKTEKGHGNGVIVNFKDLILTKSRNFRSLRQKTSKLPQIFIFS